MYFHIKVQSKEKSEDLEPNQDQGVELFQHPDLDHDSDQDLEQVGNQIIDLEKDIF
jgi:hypothetical protein